MITLTTKNKTYKDKFYSMQKDIKQLKQDVSDKTYASLYHKHQADQLINELDILKSKFENTDFNFKKFDGSSKKLLPMIETQLKYQENKSIGLGFQTYLLRIIKIIHIYI